MKWLDREMVSAPHLLLATDEKSFQRAMRDLKVAREKWPQWLADDANGSVQTYANPKGGLACIVSLRPQREKSGIYIAGVIIHESVHVFQEWCIHFEERNPSREFEAYSIEAISKVLMKAYVGQVLK